MKSLYSAFLLLPLLCSFLFGQSAHQAMTFHVQGTVTDPLEAVIPGVKITFQSGQLDDKVVTTNGVGAYEADLPLGAYTMTAQRPGFRIYRRPLFQVSSRADVTIDVSFPVGKNIDIVERPATPEEIKAATNATTVQLQYYGQESFPLPSSGDTPYELLIRYTKGERTNDTHDYAGEKTPYDDPVFVAYNLFSLHADRVTYNVRQHTLGANGDVVVADGSGATRRADAMSFKIEGGQATPLR